ncbi:hypothetical protein AAFF_G00020370 [Aldrovandia affinis]|uniref:Uncharacterized protein n=1 Tax=Aldrovandia affinis TaxID=143900 RepID=A0AAD7S572_9TELE|nr:hypothetical protein AAFF_G00020370 [Aldrovandia affinis]
MYHATRQPRASRSVTARSPAPARGWKPWEQTTTLSDAPARCSTPRQLGRDAPFSPAAPCSPPHMFTALRPSDGTSRQPPTRISQRESRPIKGTRRNPGRREKQRASGSVARPRCSLRASVARSTCQQHCSLTREGREASCANRRVQTRGPRNKEATVPSSV